MRKNKLKELFEAGKPIINSWLSVPSSFSAEVMSNQGWDSLTIDMQHGLIDYSSAVNMLQAISTTKTIPMARVNWNEPGQIMKILDAGCYGIICPMVSNRKEAENFIKACLYPPKGYRSFGPIRATIYGGDDYAKNADNEILKLAMIETKEALEKLDEILDTPNLDGIYIGPADLSLAVGEEPSFDKPENTKVYKEILRILDAAKKRNLLAGLHNGSAEYAQRMIEKGFNLVTVGSDSRYISAGAKSDLKILKKIEGSKSKGY